MSRGIELDRKLFRDVIGGRLRKELKKFFSTGKFVTQRGKDYMSIPIKKIDIPHIVYGDQDDGIGRGAGKKGDVVGQDPAEGDGAAGDQDGETMLINVPMEDIIAFLKDELQLPDLLPKQNETFQDIKIKYNNIALTGPESLRHNRRTMLQALKRLASTGELEKLHVIPGYADPVKLITPINSDRRYRQYKEIRIPSSSAVIMFARDGSGSMTDDKCGIVSDMCWWIDLWIRNFYERVERCYFWHDINAQETDEENFYKIRSNGGTTCSSCAKLMSDQFVNRFPPEKWNIYCFYFTDGDSWGNDNEVFTGVLKDKFPGSICNLFAITQVLCDNYNSSLKKYCDENVGRSVNYRSVSIGKEDSHNFGDWAVSTGMTDEDRNLAIKKAIKHLLGAKETKKSNPYYDLAGD